MQSYFLRESMRQENILVVEHFCPFIIAKAKIILALRSLFCTRVAQKNRNSQNPPETAAPRLLETAEYDLTIIYFSACVDAGFSKRQRI